MIFTQRLSILSCQRLAPTSGVMIFIPHRFSSFMMTAYPQLPADWAIFVISTLRRIWHIFVVACDQHIRAFILLNRLLHETTLIIALLSCLQSCLSRIHGVTVAADLLTITELVLFSRQFDWYRSVDSRSEDTPRPILYARVEDKTSFSAHEIDFIE